MYLNKDRRARGFLYLTDGKTTNYKRGDYTLHEIEYDGKDIRFLKRFGKDLDFSSIIEDIRFFGSKK